MSSALEKKKAVVADIASCLSSSKGTIIADYRGLNAKQTEELRQQARQAGVSLRVLKNTLTLRASKEAGLEDLEQYLTGPSMLAFCDNDAVASAKLLHGFAKKNKALELKGGVVEGNVVSLNEVKVLAELPSREGLLSMLLSVLQAPVRNFALAVKAVADQRENQ